jgi:hypothetical protein
MNKAEGWGILCAIVYSLVDGDGGVFKVIWCPDTETVVKNDELKARLYGRVKVERFGVPGVGVEGIYLKRVGGSGGEGRW